MSLLREVFSLSRFDTDSNSQEPGGIPQSLVEITTVSNLLHHTVQIVGTAHELISTGDVNDDCLVYFRVRTVDALVSYGPVVSAAFVPVCSVEDQHGWVKLGVGDSIGGLYLKSSLASTEVEVLLIKLG